MGSDAAWVFGSHYDDDGKHDPVVHHVGLPRGTVDAWRAIKGNGIHIGAVIVRREVFGQVGMFDCELHRGEDRDMLIRIAERFPEVGFSPKPTMTYQRAVTGSLTAILDAGRDIKAAAYLYRKHSRLSRGLPRRAAQIVMQQRRSVLLNMFIRSVKRLLGFCKP